SAPSIDEDGGARFGFEHDVGGGLSTHSSAFFWILPPSTVEMAERDSHAVPIAGGAGRKAAAHETYCRRRPARGGDAPVPVAATTTERGGCHEGGPTVAEKGADLPLRLVRQDCDGLVKLPTAD